MALEGVHQLRGTAREPAAAELRRDICDQLLRMAMLLNNSRELEEPAASPLEARGPGSCGGSPVRRVPSPAPSVQFDFERCCEEAFEMQESLVGGARHPPPHPFRLPMCSPAPPEPAATGSSIADCVPAACVPAARAIIKVRASAADVFICRARWCVARASACGACVAPVVTAALPVQRSDCDTC